MVFCQFSKSNSLREIEYGMHSSLGDWNHLGIDKIIPKRTNLSYNNQTRDHMVFQEIYVRLLEYYQNTGELSRIKFKTIKRKIYILDSTTISLCLKLFEWAKYQVQKGAIKLHTMLNYDGCLPSYIFVRPAVYSDLSFAKRLLLPLNSIILLDRGYQDFSLFYQWHKQGVIFVTRLKSNIHHGRVREIPLPDTTNKNILVDEVIQLSGADGAENYPEELRRVVVYDQAHDDTVEILTNNFSSIANTIAELYRQRLNI